MVRVRSINKKLKDEFSGDSKTIAKAVRSAFMTLIQSPEGELIIAELMRFSGMSGCSFIPGASSADFAFVEGKRAVVHRIMQIAEMTEAEMYREKARKEKDAGN